MNCQSWTTLAITSLLLPAALLAQSAAPAAPVPPAQKILIHVYSSNPADWQAAVEKANSTMSSAKPGSTVVEMLLPETA